MSNSKIESAPSYDDMSKLPLNPEELETLTKPKVLISGAGLGGLTLAILLHKAKIPFLVFEKAYEVKPLGMSTRQKQIVLIEWSFRLTSPQLMPGVLHIFNRLGARDWNRRR